MRNHPWLWVKGAHERVHMAAVVIVVIACQASLRHCSPGLELVLGSKMAAK